MPVERSAGIILFRNTSEGRKYLVIRSSRAIPDRPEFWDFPKGRLDGKETGIEAARREAIEEAGIKDFALVDGFKETIRYFTRREGKPIPKFVALFLAESKTEKVKLSWEHDAFEWLPYEEARKKVSLPQMKEALEAAEKLSAEKEKGQQALL